MIDIGYLKRYDDNEVVGAEMAKDILPKFGYDKEKIEKICGMIMATKMPQSPKDSFGKILCDADLSNKGSKDFFDLSKKYREELALRGETYTDDEWNMKRSNSLKAINILQVLHEYYGIN